MIDPRDWLFLILLAILWGASYFFAGVAVRELPPLTIVLARVALAAAILVPVHWLLRGALPGDLKSWMPFIGMSIFNNVIPFSLIVTGQTQIASGLASVLNATTPLFAVIIMATSGDEKLIARKLLGIAIGLAGVIILRGESTMEGKTIGIALCLAAALSYGFAGLWGRRWLAGIPPLTSATCQLICSSVIVALLAGTFEQPWRLRMPSIAAWSALLGFAALSTALAYIVFFQILARSGAANVMLVTLLVPVTAIFLGYFILDEPLHPREIIGAIVIASSLLIIDGRVLRFFR
ncbi:MAG TPA: DMT family transporter [Aestuariivirga sp.]|nr:DMT family transporter [Aestuariivirga sp.]